MPIYKNNGFYVTERGKVAPLSIEVGVTQSHTTYEVVSTRRDDILPGVDIHHMQRPYRFIANDEDLLAYEDPSEPWDDNDGGADILLGAFRWGAGRETQMMVVDGDGMVLPLGGDSLPEFTRGQDNTALFEEWFSTIHDEPVRARVIDEGPLQPGRFAFADLFTDATTGQVLQGNDEENNLRGDGNAELIVGLGGNDKLIGRGGADTVLAGQGRDILKGGGGKDFLNGHDGGDRLYGQNHNDELRGGGGRDKLFGNRGNDLLDGGRGNDRLDGGLGNDELSGGGGADSFVFRRGSGNDVVRDFGGKDTLLLQDNLWKGDLSEQQVVRRFADVTDDGVVFDFGKKGSILLEDVNSLRGLYQDIDFI